MLRPGTRPIVIHIIAPLMLATVANAQASRPAAETPLPTSLPADQIDVRTGITFGKPGGTILNLDMAMPKVGKGPRPAVVCLFGGGWISGSRTGMRSFIQYLAGYGYVAVAPTYRLAPQYPFPAAVADVRQCVRWLRRNAKEYNIDPDHIGAMGQSAGGHLALMLGLASDKDRFGPDDEPQAGESARVQAVVNYFGPGDMASKEWSALANRRFIVPFLGGTPAERPEEYRKASPITYVTRDAAPILTLQGDKDTTVPMPMAVELHKKLDAVGAKNKLVIFKGLGHGTWREPFMTDSRRQMVRFFDEYLKNRTAASRPAALSR